MARYLVFVIAFSVLAYTNFSFVQCADKCKTHADCKTHFWKYCCGGYLILGSKDRTCTSGSCLLSYCSSDSDCGDPSLCCRSNECVNKGCSGCTSNTDCYTLHVCCKKTFTVDQTVCAANCISQTCNSNDDCAGRQECCRSGKCTSYTGCNDKCTSDSECNLGQYCCKKKKTRYMRDTGCAKTCVGEICRTVEDCGARNECCIFNKCVDRGCSGCTTNSNCSTGHYCCKQRQWYNYYNELSVCGANCIGKSCSTSDDCGGPGETCDSNNRCNIIRTINRTINRTIKQNHNSFPPWLIAVLTVSLVIFFVAVGIVLAVFWYVRKKRPANAIQTRNVPLQNTQYQGAEIQNRQPNTQFSGPNNPTTFQNQLQHGENNVAHPSHNPVYHPQGFQNGAEGTPNQGLVFQNPTNCPQQGNECQFDSSQNYDNQGQPTEQNNFPVYHTLEAPNARRDTHYQGSSGQQMYPQNIQHQGKDYIPTPPYNPQYQGNH